MKNKTSCLFKSSLDEIRRRNTLSLLRPTRDWLAAPLLIICLLNVDAIAESQADNLVIPMNRQTDPVLEFQHSYRWQTAYSLKIYEDGEVIFNGYTITINDEPVHRPVVGVRRAHITRQQVNELALAFLSLPFKELRKYEGKMSASAGGADLIFFRSPLSKIDIIDPIFYSAIMTKVKKITDIQQWVCYPEGHPQYSQYCLEDLPDDFQF